MSRKRGSRKYGKRPSPKTKEVRKALKLAQSAASIQKPQQQLPSTVSPTA